MAFRRHAILGVAALISLSPGLAAAHGPPPQADHIVLDATDPDFLLVGTVAFGLYVSHDGGETFGYVCPNIFSSSGLVDTFATRGVAIVPGTPRAVLVGGSGGLFRSEDDGCTWTAIPGLDQTELGDVEVAPDDPNLLLAGTTRNVSLGDNGVYVSRDGGRSFTATLLTGPLLYNAVWVAAANGTWYASSQDPATGEMRLHRSADAGETWVDTVVAGATRPTYVEYVDPANDQVAILLESGPTGDTLWRTDDGGATLTAQLQTDARLYRVLPRSDSALWVGTDGGAWVSQDGGVTWSRDVTAPGMTCFAQRDDALFAGTAQVHDPGGVVVSRDDGATWETVLEYVEAEAPLSCHGPAEEALCGADRWLVQCVEFSEWGLPDEELDRCISGEPEPEPEPEPKGCGCTSAAPRSLGLAWLLAVLVACRRRRKGE